jgi:hypothetical protein
LPCVTRLSDWMRQILMDYGITCDKVSLHRDSVSVLSRSLTTSCNILRQSIFHNFIRDHVNHGDIELSYIGTYKQLADIITMPLDKENFCVLWHKIIIIDSSTNDEVQQSSISMTLVHVPRLPHKYPVFYRAGNKFRSLFDSY